MQDGLGTLFTVSAPSGAGKTSLLEALVGRSPNLQVSVSHTTRARRSGETDGVNYHFVDRATFQAMLADSAFLEHAEVFGNYYGTRRDRVEALRAAGRDVLLEIDVQGAEQIRATHPDVCSIFILPPSMPVLAERLRARGSDSPAVIERRLGEARREMAACGEFRWMVVNDDFDRALDDLHAVIRCWPLRRQRQRVRVTKLLDEKAGGSTMND